MAGQITDRPPFEPPQYYKRARLWSERKISDQYTDGDPRHWPGKPTYRPSADEHYLCHLGQKWAEKDGTAQYGVQYYIDKLPRGYAMFETDQPGGPQTYKRLFGHPSGRFYDSATKFEVHFLWLMSGMDEDCQCIHCAKKGNRLFVRRGPRAPREAIDQSSLLVDKRTATTTATTRIPRDLTDNENETSSSRTSPTGGIASKRTHRQVRQPGGAAPLTVDEEGSADVYKDCLRKLENQKDAKTLCVIDLVEDGSIDWKAERECLPQYLTQIEQQHCFIPRVGELVLWCPNFLDDHYLMHDPSTLEYKFYSFEQKCFHGFPDWRGGVVTAVPSASVKNGPVDFTDILDTPVKKTAFNTAGFRIETMPDPNDDMNKAMSKQYRYVPLRNIRPLAHWQILLKGIAQNKLHPSIEYALTCMTSLSLVEKWQFRGSWPDEARIYCKGIFLGSELITVGDTIRLLPSKSEDDLRPDILVVDSIAYTLLGMKSEHTGPNSSHVCTESYIAFFGSAYTMDLTKLIQFQVKNGVTRAPPSPLKTPEVKTMIRSVGAEEYGLWYPWHEPRQRYEVSHELVLGRMYEADAVRLWTGERQIKLVTPQGSSSPSPSSSSRPSLDFDAKSIFAGRNYATATDARLPEPQSLDQINWYLSDTRAEALAVATINGLDVGKYHDIRTPSTLRHWRTQVSIADGKQIVPEGGSGSTNDQIIKNYSTAQLYGGKPRGRKAGAKVIDGKVVYFKKDSRKQDVGNNHDGAVRDRPKPSSRMAEAAVATDNEDSSEDYDSDEDSEDDEVEQDNSSRGRHHHQRSSSNEETSTGAVRSKLSKAAIMSSIEVPDDRIFDDDVSSDEEAWWMDPPPLARGGTEESEGGDYRE